MKTHIITKILVATVTVWVTASCSVKKYHTVTTFNRNGSFLREIYTSPDSLFLKGDMSRNPFLFKPDSEWEISEVANSFGDFYPQGIFAPKPHKTLLKISGRFNSLTGYSKKLQYINELRPMAAPAESLKRKFRWFYTCYSFEAVYPSIYTHVSETDINTFMSSEEQAVWFSGNSQFFNGMNGIEIKKELDNIEQKYMNWVQRALFDINFDIIDKYMAKIDGNPYTSSLSEIKDTLFYINFTEKEAADTLLDRCSTQSICKFIDQYLKTGFFSQIHSENSDEITLLCDVRMAPLLGLLEKDIYFHLIMPGKTFGSNTTLQRGDTLVWKIDAARLIASSCILSAQSRHINSWAIIVTALIVFAVIYHLKNKFCV